MKEQIAKITTKRPRHRRSLSSSTKQYLEFPVERERDDCRSIYAFLGVSEFWMAKLSGSIVVQIKFQRPARRPAVAGLLPAAEYNSLCLSIDRRRFRPEFPASPRGSFVVI